MQSLGYETLVSIILPGALNLASVWLLLIRFAPCSKILRLLQDSVESEWGFGIVVLLGSVLFGGISASVLEFLEWKIFDRTTAKRLKISRELYDEEWYLYVESLERVGNSYISRKVIYFFFELRAGTAITILSFSAFAWAGNTTIGYIILFVGLGLAVALLLVARETHHLLAWWRHRLFDTRACERLKA